jgi:hypothetical protein
MVFLAMDWIKSTEYEENLLQMVGLQPMTKRRYKKEKPWMDLIGKEEKEPKKKKKKKRRSEEFEAD